MLGNFDEIAQQTLIGAKKEMQELKHPYVGTEHFVLSLLKGDNAIALKLKEYHVTYDNFKRELLKIIGPGNQTEDQFLYTPLLKRILEDATLEGKDQNEEVRIEDLFSSLLENGEGIAIRIFIKLGVDLDELYQDFHHDNGLTYSKKKDLFVLQIGDDLTKKALEQKLDPVVEREKELQRLMQILGRRTKNNPILIGEAGVGKTAIVEELARRIAFLEVPNFLRGKRIISLNMASLVAGTKYRGEFEERINKMLKELEENDDIIIFIDEIHTLVGAGGAEGAIDASNIFKPALARNKIRCIGATTTEEYKKYIENDSALERRFQKITVEEPKKQTVKAILMKLKPIYEKFHKVSISEAILDHIIDLSSRYIYDRYEPDRSIDVLDEVCASVSMKEGKEQTLFRQLHEQLHQVQIEKKEAILNQDFKEASRIKEKEKQLMSKINHMELKMMEHQQPKEVAIEDVAKVLHIKTGIPIYEILKDHKSLFQELEKKMTHAVVGQNEAVTKLLQITKKIKLGFQDDHRCYSYLFVGPTGVGKTKLASIFAKTIYGDHFIKLDMSDYMEAHSISKIIGAPPGYVGYMDHRNLLEEVRNHPYSVLLLDEIEKAHPSILNLFLQILDEGKIKDANGRIVRFDHVIVIMTSNVGCHEPVVGFQMQSNEQLLTKLKEQFSMEFMNRIDEFVSFHKLTEGDLQEIITKELITLQEKYEKRGIQIQYHNDIISRILCQCDYQSFGARKVGKVIQGMVESIVIDKVMDGKKEIFLTKKELAVN